MRYDKQHKERTRQRLLAEAAAAIKTVGPEQLGVASLMARLGLTHGGFYAHFKSKDDLIDQALEASFEQASETFFKSIEGRSPQEGLGAYIDYYLSMAHVGRPEVGCPLPTLSVDMARTKGPARDRLWDGANRLAERLAGLLEKSGVASDEADRTARSAMAEMAGAVMIARTATDAEHARQVIDASRRSVKQRLGLAVD
jgi:TetR/AcrR family transcriptional regulator, transcriptional repressor for nem operon